MRLSLVACALGLRSETAAELVRVDSNSSILPWAAAAVRSDFVTAPAKETPRPLVYCFVFEPMSDHNAAICVVQRVWDRKSGATGGKIYSN